MTRIVDLLFTQECLNKLEELFYTTFYCNTYTGYENVVKELSKIFNTRQNNSNLFKQVLLREPIEIYLLATNKNYTIDDDVMKNIIFHSILKLFVAIIIPTCDMFDIEEELLNRQFILQITGNINIMHFIQKNCDIINHIYGEDVYKEYGWNEYINYIKEELTEYFEFNSQGSTLK